MRELLVVGTVAILSLLLFGCVGPQEKVSEDSGIGDRQIAVTVDEQDEPLYLEEEIIEPPEAPEEPGETELSISDIDVFEESDFDIMMDEDIIEPY